MVLAVVGKTASPVRAGRPRLYCVPDLPDLPGARWSAPSGTPVTAPPSRGVPLARRAAGTAAGRAPAGARPRGAVPGGSRSAESRPGAIRLTRRGVWVLRLLVGMVVGSAVLGGVLIGGQVATAGEDARSVPVGYRVVMPGETLWGIAGQLEPGVDRRETVARLVELNALETAAVRAGQRIAIPARD